MSSEQVEFSSNGGQATGYLSIPGSGSGRGVIVIQEWWGLNDQIRSTADRFAGEGFTALAPDFFHGKSAATHEPDEAGKLMMALQANEVAKDAKGAAKFLAAHESCSSDKVGVIGFCMGGKLALLTGTVAPDEIGAVVDMYGIHPNINPDYSQMKAAVLGLFAGEDPMVDAAAIDSLEKELQSSGVNHEFHTYPNAGHAFMNEERPDAFNKEASENAWARVIEFFKMHLD